MALSPLIRQRALFAYLCVIWGCNWVAQKIGALEVPPGLFSGLRWFVAGLLLLAFLKLRGERLRLRLRLLPRLTMLSILMIPISTVMSLYALRYIATGLAAVINAALTPLAMVGFAAMMGQETFRRRHAVAIGVGIAGMLLLFGPQAIAGRLDIAELLGALGVMGGNLAYSYASVDARPLLRVLPPVQLVAVTNLLGGAILLVCSIAFEPGARAAATLHWSVAAWIAWWYLLLPASLGASIAYFLLVRDWGAGRTGTYAFISPVVAVLIGVFLYGEHLVAADVAGMVLMLLAAGIALGR